MGFNSHSLVVHNIIILSTFMDNYDWNNLHSVILFQVMHRLLLVAIQHWIVQDRQSRTMKSLMLELVASLILQWHTYPWGDRHACLAKVHMVYIHTPLSILHARKVTSDNFINFTAVVGWINPTLEVSEGDIGVQVMVNLVKGDPSALPTLLRFSYAELPGSATSMTV